MTQCFTFLDARFQKGLPTNPLLPLRVAVLTQAFLEKLLWDSSRPLGWVGTWTHCVDFQSEGT